MHRSVVPSQELLLNQEANAADPCAEFDLENAFFEIIPFVANSCTANSEDQLGRLFKTTLVFLFLYDKKEENETWKMFMTKWL